MRPTTDLAKLREAVNGRLRRIRRVTTAAAYAPAGEASRSIAFGVVELDNLILGSMREFIVSSLRGARTASGHRISLNGQFSASNGVAAYVLSVVSAVGYANMGSPQTIDRRNEVKIRDPKLIEKVLLHYNASNLSSVQIALSINTSLFRDIASVRNFYAHRNGDTWKKVRNQAQGIGALNIKHPDELMSHHLPSRPVTLFEDWLDDAELFFTN